MLGNGRHHRTALPVRGLGDAQLILAAIGGAALTHEDALVLELVDQSHHSAGNHAKSSRELSLIDVRSFTHHPQNADVGRREIEGREALGKPFRHLRPDLTEQERRS